MQRSIRLKIPQAHIRPIFQECLNSNLIAQNTPEHQGRPLLQRGPAININILLDQFLNDLLPFIAATNCGQVNAIFPLCSHNSSGINGMLVVAPQDLSDALDVALVAGLEELFLLFLFLAQVVVPHLLEEGLQLGQWVDVF